jgi:hypothetical protein
LQYEAQLRRRDEAAQTVDAYRAAFEEQLYKNKQLMLKLAELAVAGPSKYEKAKVMLKNLIHLLNDGKLIWIGRMTTLTTAF